MATTSYNLSQGASSNSLARWSKLATDPIRNFRFIAIFSAASGDTTDTGVENGHKSFTGGFSQIGGLSINTQAIPYREGGMNTSTHYVPGMTTFQPLTLQRGAIWGNTQAITWAKMLFAAAAGEGVEMNTTNNNFRCDIDIYVLDHPATGVINGLGDVISEGAYRMHFKVHNAWISSLTYNDLNASDNQVMYETMQLVHEGLSVEHVKTAT